jgi:hypothetical protein
MTRKAKMPISTYVRKHLICELKLKNLCKHQQQSNINVWAGVAGGCLICSYVLPYILRGNPCRDNLLQDQPSLLEAAPLSVRTRMWCMHYGAPAHCSRYARGALNNSAHTRWTGTGGPTAWPELNPPNCYLRGYLTTLVTLHRCTLDAGQTIGNYPGDF